MARSIKLEIGPDSDDVDGQHIGVGNDDSVDAVEASDDGGIGIDPASIGGTDGFDPEQHIGRDKRNADGSYRKKRGRKSGQKNQGNNSDLKASIDQLSAIIAMSTLGISTIARAPEFAFTKEESNVVALSTKQLLEAFDVQPDPRVTAVAGFASTVGPIFGYKYFTYRNRKKKENAEKREHFDVPNDANIFSLNGLVQ